jgi:imidazolonepropionase-like amidohydrolase/Tol biopolymer transport system component
MRKLLPLLFLASPLAFAHPDDEAPAAPPDPPKSDAKKPDWNVEDPHGPSHEISLDLTEGTWMSVTVGDRIVFDLLGDLWSIPLTGGEATRLTSGVAWDCQPRFSPDGKTIAFTSDRDGNEQLWLMDADGKNPRKLTDENDARITEPVWDPSGKWVYGRRRTIDTRSIGVTEIWQYHLDGGKGFALTKLDEHPHAGELAASDRYLWFSDRAKRFDYDENPIQDLWTIHRLDRRNGTVALQVHGSGGASRPTLSPDGKSMAFLSRVRSRTQLEVVDLATGKRRVAVPELDRDEMEAFALHGTYPELAWTKDGLYYWAKGHLWRLGTDGKAVQIPFHAKGTWRLHDVQRWANPIGDAVTARVIRWPSVNTQGQTAFSAIGALWVREPDGKIRRVSEKTGYAPSFSADGKRLAWTSWDDRTGGALHLTDVRSGKDEVLPVKGQLVNPAWGDDGSLVVLRGIAGGTSPDLGDESWYEIVHVVPGKKGWTSSVVTSASNRGTSDRAPKLHLHDGRVWLMEDVPAEGRKPPTGALVSFALDGTDKRTHLTFTAVDEIAISPDFTEVAYKSRHQGYVTALPMWGKPVDIDALPGIKLTTIVGDWLAWTPDGKSVTWAEGPALYRKPVSSLVKSKDDKPDTAGLVKTLIDLQVPRAKPSGVTALTHARVLSMKGDEVLADTTVVVDQDRIVSVGGPVPAGATVIDCTGKTIIPGLVDVHAHLHYTAGDVLPEQEWRYQTALDFGVTTVHDPSASTDLVFTQAERVDAGYEKGPRVYSTGFILYGALSNQGADTPDPETAINHVKRMEAAGARSVKVYQQSQRARRQWYVQACDQEHVLCVPEGGGDMFQNLGMIADGFQAVEHALPESPLYADVRGFVAGSHTATSRGTAYTPTLLVAYGGLMGEDDWWQNHSPIDDPRLLRHFPARELDAAGWRRPLHVTETTWNYQSVARDAAALAKMGTLVTLGAHGQLQGLGAHWELWSLAGPGAMSPMEALHAGTINGATYLGLDKDIGTVEAGKLADLIVLDADPLADIHNTAKIAFVVKNGEIFQ